MMKKKRWPRDEVLYNRVQESEFLHFFDFVQFVSLKVCKTKRMRNAISCLLIWHKFPNLSTRRARSLLLVFRNTGLIRCTIPCFKTLSNYREDNSLQLFLDKLIEESSKPLSVIEHDFATDASGIRTTLFSTWYSLRCNKRIKRRDHLTAHISTGVKSNIVTAVDIRIHKGGDNEMLRKHVDTTAQHFKVHEWSGDGLYWCKENCKKVVEVGAKPYFKVHANWAGKARGGFAWKEMNLEFKRDEKAYNTHYHKRSNVESTFHSKKALHGNAVYSRLPSARMNEETLRWINHNQMVLNRARHEWNIHAKFMD